MTPDQCPYCGHLLTPAETTNLGAYGIIICHGCGRIAETKKGGNK